MNPSHLEKVNPSLLEEVLNRLEEVLNRLEEVDGVWVTATESLFDSGWDNPTEENWGGYNPDDTDDPDNMGEEESDKVTAKFWWLGPCIVTVETHEAPGTAAEYRLTVGVQQHLADLLVDAVHSGVKKLTPFMRVVRKYVDDFFTQGYKESVRVLEPTGKGVELRFTSALAETSNPVWLNIQFTTDAAEPRVPPLHVFKD